MGFVLPWENWMKNELRSFCEESILNLDHYPAFNMRRVNSLWKNFLNGKPNANWIQVWSLVVLGKWTSINLSTKNN
jgi:asparagine synthase (glutamine-hydrolysing)